MQFGRSSEKRENQIEQLELRLEELEVRRRKRNNCNSRINGKRYRGAPCVAAIARSLATGSAKSGSPKQCSLSGLWEESWKHLGEDISEILNTCWPVSKSFIMFALLVCAGCDRIVQAEAPSRPIDRGMAGPGLLAHVLVSKYVTTYRCIVSRRSMRVPGVELDRSTLAEWVGGSRTRWRRSWKCCAGTFCLPGNYMQNDIPRRCWPPDGKTKTGRLWTLRVRCDRPAGPYTRCSVVRVFTGSRGSTPARTGATYRHTAGRWLRRL